MKKHEFLIPGGDTDSISFCRPDFSAFSDEEIKELLAEMNEISPEFMDWEDDGYYLCQIVLKAKNYILLKTNKKTGEDEIVLRGSSLKDSKKEPALKEMMTEVIKAMLYDKLQDIPSIYQRYIEEAANITDINRWAVKKSISKKLMESERKNETDVMDAIPDKSQVREGDKIFIYNAVDGMRQQMEDEMQDTGEVNEKGKPVLVKTGRKVPAFYKNGAKKGQPKMELNSFLKQTRFYNNDADVAHYYDRCFATISIFSEVLDISSFKELDKQLHKALKDREGSKT